MSGTLNILLLGFGSVGQGFAKILPTRIDFLRKNYLIDPKVIGIVDRSGAAIDPQGLDLKLALKTKHKEGKISKYPKCGKTGLSGLDVLDTVDADVVIEVTPTNIVNGEPGLSHILKAMEMGSHVVTSNKGPLALAFQRLADTAMKHGVQFRYNGTVGGAIPIVSLARRCLVGNTVLSARGILNSTSNYVLTKMTKEGITMEEALKIAHRMGIAEKDPTYDIDGIDTACKIVILANAIMGRNATYRDVGEIKGVRNVTVQDISKARSKGFAIKLIGTVDEKRLRVRPENVPFSSPICVDGTLNSVILRTEFAKDITIIGKGAGPVETASTVLSDLIDIVRIVWVRR